MEYCLTEMQKTVKQMARTITDEKIMPVRAELDEKEQVPRDIIKNRAETDLLGVYIPEEYGGLGGGCLEFCLVTEELSRGCAGMLSASVALPACMRTGTPSSAQRSISGRWAGSHIVYWW